MEKERQEMSAGDLARYFETVRVQKKKGSITLCVNRG
jgi:hypothetical protein